MRVSTSTIFDTNVSMLNQQQTALLHTNQQVASGRRMLTPADDPAASANALQIMQADATNTQYATNRNTAKSSIGLAEAVLQNVTNLLSDVKTSAVQAGNGALSNNDKQTIATELQGRLDQLIALANTSDGTGNYLFSGYQGKTIPFVNTSTGIQYMADDGQRMIQVSSSRQMAGSESGADIFTRIKNGNGKFVTEAPIDPATLLPTNVGNASITQGAVTGAVNIANLPLTISFADPATYSITDVNGNAVIDSNGIDLSNVNYISGQAITLPGMVFSISGTPAAGDSFSVKPSSNEGIFKTMTDLIQALNTATPAQLTTSLGKAMSGLDRGLDSVLTARASLGARLNELDTLQTTGEDLGLQFKQTLSTLQDLDYNKAISDLNRQTTSLQAAQKSFKQISDLSLFNYM
ncbi:MAG: flagellar hook-associated protein FlgL [Gallionellaceae bacterium]